jgi:hypothetical protein
MPIVPFGRIWENVTRYVDIACVVLCVCVCVNLCVCVDALTYSFFLAHGTNWLTLLRIESSLYAKALCPIV